MSAVLNALPAPQLFYDTVSKDYRMATAGGFIRLNERSVCRQLRALGLSDGRNNQTGLSQVEQILVETERERSVELVGAVAGHRIGLHTFQGRRFLVTHEPRMIIPAPGEWSLIDHILCGMFAAEEIDQRPFIYAWLKLAMQAIRSGIWQPGHICALAGPPNSGKSFFQKAIITPLLGGRSAKPHQFVSGETSFNADLFGAEHLVIEDESEATDMRSRTKLAAALKSFAVNEEHRVHAKGKDGMLLRPIWRVSVSLNDDGEGLLALPPLREGMQDKICLFKVARTPMPMPTETAEQQAAFRAAVTDALPAFAHFLESWSIPAEIAAPRMGFAAFQHPELADGVRETAPETRLLALIDEFFGEGFDLTEQTATQITRTLVRTPWTGATDAEKLLRYDGLCGRYLAQLCRTVPGRVTSRLLQGNRLYTIHTPPGASAGSGHGWGGGQHGASSSPIPAPTQAVLPT